MMPGEETLNAAAAMRRLNREWPSFHGSAVPAHSDAFEIGYDFVRAFHHRLCQPLTALCGTLEMMQMELEGDTKLVDQLQIALTQSSRAIEMMGVFRQLFEAETPFRDTQAAALSVVLKEVADDLQLLAKLQNVKIDICVCGEPARVKLPPKLLRQMLWSLIQNCVELSASGGYVRIEVRGSRMAITDDSFVTVEEIANLFDPFAYCDNKKRASRVSNLPLALAQRIVIAAGGCIAAARDEAIASGRCFEIELPG